MSTESPTTPPPAEATTPGAAVKAAWQKFKRGELVSYRVMAVMLLVLAGGIFFVYMQYQGGVADSKMWLDLELASSPEQLEKVMTDYPGSVPAQLAEFHLARIQLAAEGLDQLVTGEPQQRQKALAAIEKAKDTFTKLAGEFKEKDSPVMLAECYLGLAKAELALVGMTKEGRLDVFLGDPRAAADNLDKLAALAEGTPWGDEAKSMATALRAPGGATTQDISRVQLSLYNMALFPRQGGGGMFGPGGGMPFAPGASPFGPGASPFGPIPGMPSGGPLAPLPPGHPPVQ